MTLEDVAKRARVSTATVSPVLNGARGVRPATRALVLRAVQELNYTPDLNARSLAGGPPRLLGMVVSNIANPFFLDIFRSGEFLAKNKTEKEIYRLCIQDEARHVSYGTMHLKYFLEHHPQREQAIAEMHALAEVAEMGIPGFLTNPFIIEPVAVLMGDGVKGIDKGMEAIRMVWVRMREEYLNRCAIAGFDRREITKVPAQAPF